MSRLFNVTFRPGSGGDTPARAVAPAAIVPVLRPHDLFPTRIWQAQLEACEPHLAGWVAEVQAMRAADPEPAGRTVRQGWNSREMTVLERPAFAALRDAIRAGCASALAEMGQGKRAFELQSWINLHDRGGFNFLHLHEGSLLSGSFYLSVPAGSGDFVFRDPRPGVIHGFAKGGGVNAHADIHLTPSAGLLVLFPCWMEHYVEPHEGDEPRIAIAFNANPLGGERP